MNRIAVFQHLDIEHPGIFREFLADDGISWDRIELDQGDAIPDLRAYDALWVMGGPMDVWEEDQYPWLVPEKEAIRIAVNELKLPFLGICLGHQLLAEALGGKVGKAAQSEVGVMDIELTEAGRRHQAFSGFDAKIRCLQWHGAEVSSPPPGALVLAESPACAVQAMAFGDRAISAQFHVEITDATVAEWAEVPAYKSSLEESLGAGAVERLKSQADQQIERFNRDALLFYRNWLQVTQS